ncbi:MAG: sulfurtransferase-like selenium metabolism protein YedF [Dethiobacter sp.]|jgi:selenium metabolism protein YedF|nr:sulfurtransferase-like selenium metabolism protein YedF [Dethiobacter sp.]
MDVLKLDCRGLSCPQPVVETKKKLDAMTKGVLTVLVDNETAVKNLSKLAGNLNLDSSVIEKDSIFSVTIRKENVVSEGSDEDHAAVLLITSDTMGRGSEELGGLLMRSFLYALAEHTKLPASVYLVNAAVRLACQGSPALDSIQKMALRGVAFHSCGLCLDYFKLTDKLAAGDVTNMYAIVEQLMAGKALIL